MITFGSVSRKLLEQLKELLETRFGILCSAISISDTNNRKNSSHSIAYYMNISKRQDVKLFCKEIPMEGAKKIHAIRLQNKFSNKGRDKRKFFKIEEEYIGEKQTYDIEVDSPNHLFVLANGLIVSNSKQLVQIAHRLVVTDKDDVNPQAYNPDMPIGYPVETDDPDNEGSYLAQDIGGYKRNTLLTPKVLGDIKNQGIDNILVRSVMVGGPANGGVYAYDCGIREKGSLPSQGDFVGINAVQAISEPLTQGAISCLSPNTEVRMGNGSMRLLKDIKIGDEVLGSDINGNVKPVKVTNIFNNGIQPVYHTVYRQEEYPWKRVSIDATIEHKILQVENADMIKFKPVVKPIGIDSVNPAAIIFQYGGTNLKYARSRSIFIGNIETLDIEVDHPDHLFVLANGMVVSNSKHSGGVAGADSGKAISGFKYINQLIQVPKHFQGGATHSEVDGVITKIEDAPQGGKYIYVNNEKHYVGRTEAGDVKITANVGDRVEAGDVLTEGIPNPATIVKYKGIGEGRRYFTKMFRDALDTAGTPIHRRNIEVLSRGLINYVRLNEEVGDYAPDDILPYSMIEKEYQPRETAKTDNPEFLEGQYLERPVLHYSIGTKLRPSVIKELKKYGIKRVCANQDPPPFECEMIRGMAHVSKDPDWMTRLLGAYNKDSLLEGARRGDTSSAESTSYVPAIAFGNKDFGHIGPLKQASMWESIQKEAEGIIKQAIGPFSNVPPVYQTQEWNDAASDTVEATKNIAVDKAFRLTLPQYTTPKTYTVEGDSPIQDYSGEATPAEIQRISNFKNNLRKIAPKGTAPINIRNRYNWMGPENLGGAFFFPYTVNQAFIDPNTPSDYMWHELGHNVRTKFIWPGYRLFGNKLFGKYLTGGSGSKGARTTGAKEFTSTANEYAYKLLDKDGPGSYQSDVNYYYTPGFYYTFGTQKVPSQEQLIEESFPLEQDSYKAFQLQDYPVHYSTSVDKGIWDLYGGNIEDIETLPPGIRSSNYIDDDLDSKINETKEKISLLKDSPKTKENIENRHNLVNYLFQLYRTKEHQNIAGSLFSTSGEIPSNTEKINNIVKSLTTGNATDSDSFIQYSVKQLQDYPPKPLPELKDYTDYALFALGNGWTPTEVARARRGLVTINGKLQPGAINVAKHEQNDPKTAALYKQKHDALFQRLQQGCKRNPKYWQTMHNWQITPWEDNPYGIYAEGTLTMEQMDYINKELDAMEEEYERESNQQFQNYSEPDNGYNRNMWNG